MFVAKFPRSYIVAMATLLLSVHALASDGAEREEEYQLRAMISPAVVKVGGEATVTLTIAARAPWVLKKETPFKAVLRAPEAVSLGKSELTAKDFKDPESDSKVVETSLAAKAPGDHELEVDISFFLCTDTICKRMQDKARASIKVQP